MRLIPRLLTAHRKMECVARKNEMAQLAPANYYPTIGYDILRLVSLLLLTRNSIPPPDACTCVESTAPNGEAQLPQKTKPPPQQKGNTATRRDSPRQGIV